MPDIVAIGEAMVELNQTAKGGSFVPGFGGDTSNAMIAAARCGASTGYFTAVGADSFGQHARHQRRNAWSGRSHGGEVNASEDEQRPKRQA